MFRITFQMSPSLLALFFFALGDVVLSEEFKQGAEDQLAVESNHYQMEEVVDLPNYSQKTLNEFPENWMHHKRKSEQRNVGRSWKTGEGQNGNFGPAKSETNCSIPYTKLEHVKCRNLNNKNGYEIYSFVDGKGAKKIINEGIEEKNSFDLQKLFTEIRDSESPSKSDVLSKRLSSNAYKKPTNFGVKSHVLRDRQSSYVLNPKTALNSQSIIVHALPPDPNYSANVLNPQSRLSSNNIDKVSSYVNYNLPSPIFRNIMNENGQLVQQFMDAKPIPHNTVVQHQHSPIIPRVKQNNSGPAYYPILLQQQHNHLNQGKRGIPQPIHKNLEPVYDNKNDRANNFHNARNSKQNAHKVKNSPEPSYSKTSSNPYNYQQSHNPSDEDDSQFIERAPKGQNHHNFRKKESSTDPRNSQEQHDDHYDHNPDHEQTKYSEQTDEPITRGPDHPDSEEDTESRSYPTHNEQEHPPDEDSSNNHSLESNDYDDDPPKESDNEEQHQHNQEGSSPTHEQRKKYDDDDGNADEHDGGHHSSQEVANSYDDPNSSEDTLQHEENPNNHHQKSKDRAPKHHKDLNKFFYGNDKNDDKVKYVNLVDKEEIEKDKIKYHKMKNRENNENDKFNHVNLLEINDGNYVQTNRKKNYHAEPHHSNHNYIVRHNHKNKDGNRNHNHYPRYNHIIGHNNIAHSSYGQHNGFIQDDKEQVPLIKNNNDNIYSQHKVSHHPQNIVYPLPQLYQLNGVVGNRISILGENIPHKSMHLPNNQVYYAKPLPTRDHKHPNNGHFRNDENEIPHHILLKQSNIPLTFHHPHSLVLHSNSAKIRPNIHRVSNHFNSINNKNTNINEYDPNEKNYISNSDGRGDPNSIHTQFNNNKHNRENDDEKGDSTHQHRRNKENPSSSEVNSDRKYREDTSVNEEEQTPSHRHYPDADSSKEEVNPNHPPEEVEEVYNEDETSTEEDTPNTHTNDDDSSHRHKEASSNEEDIPDHQRQNSKNRSQYNNDDAESNEEERPIRQQSKHNERLNNDESSHETENVNHSDNEDESLSNEDAAVEDQEDEESFDDRPLNNEDDHQPQNNERNDQKFLSSKIPKHQYNNDSAYEYEGESDEHLSQEEKKNLFKKHFENEFGINPSVSENRRYLSSKLSPSINYLRNEGRQNLHKNIADSRHSLPAWDGFSDNRRSINVMDENQHNLRNENTNKLAVTIPTRQDTYNLPHKASEVNTQQHKQYITPLGTQLQDELTEPKHLFKSIRDNTQTFTQISKMNIPQFSSFGDFSFN